MPSWRERITRQPYFYHYLFWGIVLLSYVADTGALRMFDFGLFFKTMILKNGILIGIVYVHLRVFIPAFLAKKHYVAYGFCLLLLTFSGARLIQEAEHFSWQVHHVEERHLPGPVPGLDAPEVSVEVVEERIIGANADDYLIQVLTVCRFLVISVLLKFLDDYFRQWKQLMDVRHEKTLAELQALKAQVHPHFLFNTLNNIYGLVLEKSPKAPETVLQLADIMRYSLTEGDAALVPLARDLENLKAYFDLEALRVRDATNVRFVVSGNPDGHTIAPLLLLPQVENAFKYGIHAGQASPFLQVSIQIRENDLEIITLNQSAETPGTQASLGIGLQNLRRRLDLLYPGKYQLELGTYDHLFRVRLQMPLL